jgi:methionyl-tRNA formyltransferase
MDLIFMGTPEYAQKILEKLIEQKDINVVAVYTQPDKPVGRKRLLTPPEVKTLALQNDIKCYQPARLRDEETIQELVSIPCDYIVVAAYGQILPRAVLDHAPCINLHASILPQYRGASPIQQTLLNGDTKTGVTAMLMEEGLDTGDIIKITQLEVASDEMVESLFEKLTVIAADLTVDVLENFTHYTPKKQDETEATYCKKITKADGAICFDNAQEIYNKYRAFTPWPGIYLSSGLKLKELSLVENTSVNLEGTILSIEKNNIVVGCKQGTLKISRVQAPSKKEVDILSYINGKRLSLADTLS